jgi:hypothetical protein
MLTRPDMGERRRRRCSLSPQFVDRPIPSHRLKGPGHQDRDDRPLLGATQRQSLTGLGDLQRLGNPELHMSPLVASNAARTIKQDPVAAQTGFEPVMRVH